MVRSNQPTNHDSDFLSAQRVNFLKLPYIFSDCVEQSLLFILYERQTSLSDCLFGYVLSWSSQVTDLLFRETF